MRAFVALDLDEPFLDDAAAVGESLRGRAPFEAARARWTLREAMHVTLRFFGEIGEELVAPLSALVSEVAADARASARDPTPAMRTDAFVAFPDARRAHVLGLAIADERGVLAKMARAAEDGAVALGLAPETRAYRPHLTLARLPDPTDLRAVMAAPPAVRPGRAIAVTLYRSDLAHARPRYTALARAPLA